MFFKKRRYKLPKFPSTVIPAFRELCEILTAEEVIELRESVKTSYEQLKSDARSNEKIDLETAEKLQKVSHFLLDHYEEFPDNGKFMVAGAVRYFAIAEDSFDETVFACGFIDDLKIMNHVLEELDLSDWYLEI